jgi:hypothetical protein
MYRQRSIKTYLVIVTALILSCHITSCAQWRAERKEKYERLYHAVKNFDVAGVKELLQEKLNPNICEGDGWRLNNPLDVLTWNYYDTYWRPLRGENVPEPPADIAIFKLLLERKVDLKRRPYVWNRVTVYGRETTDYILALPEKTKDERIKVTREEAEAEAQAVINGANRLLAALLEAGADPDKLGHSYPYSVGTDNWMDDKVAQREFAKGTRAINEAIKKGMVWESQVDLLLQYTTMDEDSLKAAEESGDPGMMEKIERLWEAQNRKADEAA